MIRVAASPCATRATARLVTLAAKSLAAAGFVLLTAACVAQQAKPVTQPPAAPPAPNATPMPAISMLPPAIGGST
jgi:hypothetical protein